MASSRGYEKILESLVHFPTQSERSNLDLVNWTAEFLRANGARTVVLPSPDQPKANLFASIGPNDIGGVLLSAHTDVVPADAGEWSSEPFQLRKQDGRYFGRGTTDMKGFIACILHLVEQVDENKLQVPIHIGLTYDEELGCLGVPEMVAEFGGRLPKPAFAIVGEPSGMSPVTMHRGYRVYRSEIRGLAAHAGNASGGLSAIRIATVFLNCLYKITDELACGSADAADTSMATTINIGRVTGGSAVNIVPSTCIVDWEIRMCETADIGRIHDRLTELLGQTMPDDLVAAKALERITTRECAQEPEFAGIESAAFPLLRECGQVAATRAYPFGTEAGFFEKAGIPSVILGPGFPEQAHIADEYIDADQMDQCMVFLQSLAELLRERDRFGQIVGKTCQ